MIRKRAHSTSELISDPLHGTVLADNMLTGAPYGVRYDFGVDRSVGGLHDAPNPGELLCVALASCQDGLIRMLAAALGIELTALSVDVTGEVDVRGTMAIDRQVPIGFQGMRLATRIEVAEGTSDRLIAHLVDAAERLCVNLDTLRRGVQVETTYAVERTTI